MASSVDALYSFVLQQVAAESYLEGVDLTARNRLALALRSGNNRDGFEPLGLSRLTRAQVDEFLGDAEKGLAPKFEIRHQWSDNPTANGNRPGPGDANYILDANGRQILANSGFSATLILDKTNGQYTLAIRSTEFQPWARGGDQERDMFGANLSIFNQGFALAQLDSLENDYEWLKANKLPQGAKLNVTGYSLGGHLACIQDREGM